MEIPLIGLGTYQLLGKKCEQVVKKALAMGYRHIDTAFYYENHKHIAAAIKDIERRELFLTTKLLVEQVEDGRIEKSVEELCDQALQELDTDYLDLFLIHCPERNRPLEEILAAMHKLAQKGKIRYPGVSNYTIHHLKDAYDAGLPVPFNQVEFHPYLYQKELMDFAKAHGTRLIAFRSLGKGELLKADPLFAEIGTRYGKTPAQVILRWTIQKNIPVIPKATSDEHLKENFAIFDFALTSEEMEQLDTLNCDRRYCKGDWDEFAY